MNIKYKVLNYLGLARRANKLLSGGDAVLRNIKYKKAKIVFVAKDAALNTIEKFKKKCHNRKILFINDFTSDELSKAVGKPHCVVLSILDSGFSDVINRQLNGGIE